MADLAVRDVPESFGVAQCGGCWGGQAATGAGGSLTRLNRSVQAASHPTSPKPTPSQSETGPAPAQEPTIGVTTSAESPGTGGATPVSKAPVPVAGDDDDDDDGIDDGDERDDDLDDDDNDDG